MDSDLEVLLKIAHRWAKKLEPAGAAKSAKAHAAIDAAKLRLTDRLRAVAGRLRRAASVRDVGDHVEWAIRELDAIAGRSEPEQPPVVEVTKR